jgi:hypothetical protein
MTAIPSELQQLKRWHNWKDVDGTKIPIQVNGAAAKSNDPTTWTDFETASTFGMLAFELGDGYCGVDLDNCLDVFGELRSWAWKIVDRFDGVAYMEISPSGQGIKFITRGRKPVGARCVHKIGDDKQQIECYDKTRFWTVTGQVYNRQTEIGDGQAAIDWLCGEYLTSVAPAPYVMPTVSSGFGLQQRAAAYVDNIGPAGPGGRNNTAFNIAGHLWAMVGDFNERLTADQVLSNMRAWNARNFEPLGDDELQRVTDSASRNGTARAEKPSQAMPVIQPDHGVDLSGIMGQSRIPDEIQTATCFPVECLTAPGLIGELVKYNLETALYPLPELALAGALALMSSVTGGKAEGLRARTNVYVMGLAPSGGGKDYSRKLNRKILLAAGGGHICGPERIGSHAGIISALAENWNTLFQIDEIGRMLATMQNAGTSPHLFNISSVLMQIYSSADDIWQADAYGDRKKCKTLEYPHCVVYGSSVPDGFWESLSKQNLSDGLIGRFLVFENPDYVDFQDVPEQPIPETIIERARSWLEHKTHGGNLAGRTNYEGANPQRINCDEQATERLKKHAADISLRRKHEDCIEAAIWSRHAEKTNKLALLFACSRWSEGLPWPTINIGDADRAVKLNNYLTRRMLRQAGVYVSESSFETEQLKVLRVLRKREEYTQRDLTRATRWLKQRDRMEIVTTLQESGEIEIEDRETGGRPVRIYRAKMG